MFRASTPLVVSVCDYLFLGRELPDQRSILALLGLLAGTLGYVYSDSTIVVMKTKDGKESGGRGQAAPSMRA